jgi:hypothetical protein
MDCRYLGLMQLHGSIEENFENAIASARRLRGHPIYKDTLIYWADLIQEARRVRQEPSGGQSDALGVAIVRLETELAER